MGVASTLWETIRERRERAQRRERASKSHQCCRIRVKTSSKIILTYTESATKHTCLHRGRLRALFFSKNSFLAISRFCGNYEKKRVKKRARAYFLHLFEKCVLSLIGTFTVFAKARLTPFMLSTIIQKSSTLASSGLRERSGMLREASGAPQTPQMPSIVDKNVVLFCFCIDRHFHMLFRGSISPFEIHHYLSMLASSDLRGALLMILGVTWGVPG